MKIALLLSGLARKVEEGYDEYWKHVIENNDVDVYLHYWKDAEYERVLDFYQPKKYICEKPVDFSQYKVGVESPNDPLARPVEKYNVAGNYYSLPMIYGWQQVYNLIEGEYDIIIRSRFDSLYINKFVLPKIIPNNVHIRLNGWNKNTYAPRNNFILEGYNLPFVADNFAIGDYNSMKEYSSVYLGLNSYIRTMIPECCLAEQLHYKNISYQWFDELKYMSLISIHNNVLTFESDYEEKQHIFINRGL